MRISDNVEGILVLAFSFALVILYTVSNFGDLKDVGMIWVFWLAAVFFIALADDDHLGWIMGRSPKATNK